MDEKMCQCEVPRSPSLSMGQPLTCGGCEKPMDTEACARYMAWATQQAPWSLPAPLGRNVVRALAVGAMRAASENLPSVDVWRSKSSGNYCDGCGERIEGTQSEFILDFYASHGRWHGECLARLPETIHRKLSQQ